MLKMFIGKLLIEEYPLDFTDMHSVDQREQYVLNLTNQMFWLHWDKMRYLIIERDNTRRQIVLKPVFYITAASAMNDELFTNEQEDMSWRDLKMLYHLKEVTNDD